jgi:uncharacterized protein
MYETLLVLFVFLAVFIQSLAGFGSALVGMALLVPLLGISTASPLIALLGLVLEVVLLIYYRNALRVQNLWRVVAASLVGVPLGILFLKTVDERLVMFLLGLVISGYALYALLRLRLPKLEHVGWGYLFGLLAGMLGGAYNTSGPPVIIYGNCRRWSPAEFKGNLQGFFLITSLLVVVSHTFARSFTPEVWRNFFVALPALGLGLISGISLDRRIHPETFRVVVQVLLILLGLRLVFYSL